MGLAQWMKLFESYKMDPKPSTVTYPMAPSDSSTLKQQDEYTSTISSSLKPGSISIKTRNVQMWKITDPHPQLGRSDLQKNHLYYLRLITYRPSQAIVIYTTRLPKVPFCLACMHAKSIAPPINCSSLPKTPCTPNDMTDSFLVIPFAHQEKEKRGECSAI